MGHSMVDSLMMQTMSSDDQGQMKKVVVPIFQGDERFFFSLERA